MLVSTVQWSEPTVSTHILPLFWISVPFRPLWSTEKSFLCWAVCSRYLAISWKVKGKSLSHVRLFATPWTVAYELPPSTEFSRQEHWSGLPFPSPGDLPHPGIKPISPVLVGRFFTTAPLGKCKLHSNVPWEPGSSAFVLPTTSTHGYAAPFLGHHWSVTR